MKKYFQLIFLLFLVFNITSFAKPLDASFDPYADKNIIIENTVLTKVRGRSISLLDVTKKMDMFFHQSFPELSHSKAARFEFYTNSWRHILKEMINNELIIADSEEKEVKITDSEIRQEMENRFGPNVSLTLEKIGINYDEAFKLIKNEIIVRRMTGYYVNNKALQSVTPQSIRHAYNMYVKENPTVETWDYQIISVKSLDDNKAKDHANSILNIIKNENAPIDTIKNKILSITNFECSTNISDKFSRTNKEISASHKNIITGLNENSCSDLIQQKNAKDNSTTYKIFYLSSYSKKDPASFDDMANKIKNDLLNKEAYNASLQYTEKLRKQFGYDEDEISKNFPEDFEPYRIE